MTVNTNDFNAPRVEIVAVTKNTSNDEGEGLEEKDVTELPFGHDAEEYRSSNQAGSIVNNKRNKILLIAAILVLSGAGLGASVVSRNNIARSFMTSSKSSKAKGSKSPNSTKASKSTRSPIAKSTKAPTTASTTRPKPSRPSWPSTSRPGTQIPTTETYPPTTWNYEPTTFDPTISLSRKTDCSGDDEWFCETERECRNSEAADVHGYNGVITNRCMGGCVLKDGDEVSWVENTNPDWPDWDEFRRCAPERFSRVCCGPREIEAPTASVGGVSTDCLYDSSIESSCAAANDGCCEVTYPGTCTCVPAC